MKKIILLMLLAGNFSAHAVGQAGEQINTNQNNASDEDLNRAIAQSLETYEHEEDLNRALAESLVDKAIEEEKETEQAIAVSLRDAPQRNNLVEEIQIDTFQRNEPSQSVEDYYSEDEEVRAMRWRDLFNQRSQRNNPAGEMQINTFQHNVINSDSDEDSEKELQIAIAENFKYEAIRKANEQAIVGISEEAREREAERQLTENAVNRLKVLETNCDKAENQGIKRENPQFFIDSIDEYLAVYEQNRDRIDLNTHPLTFLRVMGDTTEHYGNLTINLGNNYNTLKGMSNAIKVIMTSPLAQEQKAYPPNTNPYINNRPLFIHRVFAALGLNNIQHFQNNAQRENKITEMFYTKGVLENMMQQGFLMFKFKDIDDDLSEFALEDEDRRTMDVRLSNNVTGLSARDISNIIADTGFMDDVIARVRNIPVRENQQ